MSILSEAQKIVDSKLYSVELGTKKLHFTIKDEYLLSYDIASEEVSICSCMRESFRGVRGEEYTCKHREAVKILVSRLFASTMKREVTQ